MGTSREDSLAQNEVLFRELNAAIRGGGGEPTHDFVCECSDLACQEKVTLTLDQYREVRSDSRTFFVCPDHDVDDVEDVVERRETFWIVRKHASVDGIVGAS